MSKLLIPRDVYAAVARAAFLKQGFSPADVDGMVRYLIEVKEAGNKSHDLRKMLDLRKKFGKNAGDPAGKVRILRSSAVIDQWDCGCALGPRVIYDATDTAMAKAKHFGIGMVVGHKFAHYGCGFGYAYNAVKQGMIFKLWSTASLAEVVPVGGKRPATGTNAWTLGFPVKPGKHFVFDAATSSMAMGVVQSMRVRCEAGEKVELPPDAALDANGNVTRDPMKVVSLLPFGGYKGGALSIMSELYCAYVGGGRPSVRCRPEDPDVKDGENLSTTFVLQVIDPATLWCGSDDPTDAAANVRMVSDDIFANGNESAMMAGELEQRAIAATEKAGALIFDAADVDVLIHIAEDSGITGLSAGQFAPLP